MFSFLFCFLLFSFNWFLTDYSEQSGKSIEPPNQFLPRECGRHQTSSREAVRVLDHRDAPSWQEQPWRQRGQWEGCLPIEVQREVSLTVLKVTFASEWYIAHLMPTGVKRKESLDLYFVPSSGTSPIPLVFRSHEIRPLRLEEKKVADHYVSPPNTSTVKSSIKSH